MRRRVALLAVATTTVPSPAVPAEAGTTVSDPDKHSVVTITVPVDCVGCNDWEAPGGGDLAKHWEKVAEKTWQKAFDKYYGVQLQLPVHGRRA